MATNDMYQTMGDGDLPDEGSITELLAYDK